MTTIQVETMRGRPGLYQIVEMEKHEEDNRLISRARVLARELRLTQALEIANRLERELGAQRS